MTFRTLKKRRQLRLGLGLGREDEEEGCEERIAIEGCD